MQVILALVSLLKLRVDMRFLSAVTLVIFPTSLAFAQDRDKEKLCDAASATTVGHDGGVTVQKVLLSGNWGTNDATVYLPGKETAEGAVVRAVAIVPEHSLVMAAEESLN